MKNAPLCPRNVVLVLTALVLLLHMLLLQGTPLALGLSQPQPPLQSFTTRLVTLAPTAPVVQRPPPVRAAPVTPSTTARPINTAPLPAEAAAPDTTSVEAANVVPEPPVAAAPPAAATPPPSPAPQAPHTVPGSARLQYKVETNKFPFSAHAELQWQQDGRQYDARLALSAFGQTRVQTSRGEITPAGLAPTRFSDKYRSEVAAHFNRESNQVTFSANTPNVPLLAGAQDRLSVLLQLAALIAGDPTQYPSATTVSFQTIGPRDADTWLFTVGSEETLKLPGGEQHTRKVVRNPRQEFDQKVELWLAPALGYLPARIRITEANGDFIDQQWLATEALQEPAAPKP